MDEELLPLLLTHSETVVLHTAVRAVLSNPARSPGDPSLPLLEGIPAALVEQEQAYQVHEETAP
jgi:hypothetical protein